MPPKQMRNAGVETKSQTALFALIISMVSVGFSGIALWKSSLAPADIKVSVSSLEFQYQPVSGPDVATFPGGITATRNPTLVLFATCVFANNGANNGEISDVAVQFVSDDGTRWLFLPYKILDDVPRLTDQNGRTSIEWAKAPPFTSIVLPGKQTARHTFLFLAKEFENLAPRKFRVRLLTWSDGDAKPREQQLSTIDFNTYVVAVLSNGNLSGVPFEEERQRLKNLE